MNLLTYDNTIVLFGQDYHPIIVGYEKWELLFRFFESFSARAIAITLSRNFEVIAPTIYLLKAIASTVSREF
jgi:hypothetical protein